MTCSGVGRSSTGKVAISLGFRRTLSRVRIGTGYPSASGHICVTKT